MIRAVAVLLTLAISPLAVADMKRLQSQISEYLAQPKVKYSIDAQNKELDRACKFGNYHPPQSFVRKLSDGSRLRNYEEILPGISRFEFPSLESLLQSHRQGVCDRVLTLNKECFVSQFDENSDGHLSKPESENAWAKLKKYGAPDWVIGYLVKFYQVNGRVCQSPKQNNWHKLILAEEPEENVEQIFQAAELVLLSRREGKSVCFHCAVGKHRTGLTSMLIEFADAKEIDKETTKAIYERYIRHAWFDECQTRIQTWAIMPIILQSPEFADFRRRWKQ